MWWRLVADFRRRHPMHACTAGQDSCIGTTWRVQKQSLGSGEITSSDHLVLDRPASMAVDMHGTWKLETPLSDAQSPVHGTSEASKPNDPNTPRASPRRLLVVLQTGPAGSNHRVLRPLSRINGAVPCCSDSTARHLPRDAWSSGRAAAIVATASSYLLRVQYFLPSGFRR